MKNNVFFTLLTCLATIFSTVVYGEQSNSNDSKELSRLIAESISGNKNLVLERGRTYRVDKQFGKITLKAGQNLNINGNGAKIIFIANAGASSQLFHVYANRGTNTSFTLSDITIDGSENPVQFDKKTQQSLKLAYPVFTEHVDRIEITNVNIKNIYGSGIKSNVFKNFRADNLNFSKVGGKYFRDDDFDSFGDCIYLGYAQSNSQATITNSKFEGYPATPYLGGYKENLSRAGVVTEYNKGSLLNLHVKNCEFIGYQRTIHMEASKTALTLDNSTIRRFGCGIFSFGYEVRDVTVNNSRFLDNVDVPFGGAKGVITGYANNNKGFVNNSEISSSFFYRENEMNVTYTGTKFQFERYSRPSRSSKFVRCTFNTATALGNDFGNLDAVSKVNQSNKKNILKEVLQAIFK